MDFIAKHKYLEVNPNTLEEVRQDVNLHRPGEMKEAVRILHEWIQQQPHFKKKDFPSNYLETVIVSSKGSLERAKRVIDSACTMRTLMPKIFEPVNLKENFVNVFDENYCLFLPKMTQDNCRIRIFKMVGKLKNAEHVQFIYKYAYMISDYLQRHDYSSKVVLIYDFSEIDMGNTLTKVNLFELKTHLLALLDVYGVRLKCLHVMTKYKLIEKTIAFFRPFFKKKILDRVLVHQSTNDLLQYYPRDILPKEYGGSDRTLLELHNECLEMISTEKYLEDAKSMFEAQVDESLRPQGQFNELYAGTEGSFRTLSLD